MAQVGKEENLREKGGRPATEMRVTLLQVLTEISKTKRTFRAQKK
jgi:hypothetical protein